MQLQNLSNPIVEIKMEAKFPIWGWSDPYTLMSNNVVMTGHRLERDHGDRHRARRDPISAWSLVLTCYRPFKSRRRKK